MKHRRVFWRCLAGQWIAGWLVWGLVFTSIAATLPTYSAVVPGLEYAHLQITNQPWSIHVARLDRARAGFDVVSSLGRGTIQGVSTLSAQIAALPPALGRPLAAVNGDFYVIRPGPYQGDPAGLTIVNGELVSGPLEACLWMTPPSAFHIGEVYPALRITWPNGQKTRFDLNAEPKADTAVLFTPIFGPSTRATNFFEALLERDGTGPWLPLRANQTYQARVRSLNPGGNSPLPPGAVVLSLGAHLKNHIVQLKPGAPVRFSTDCSKDLSRARTAIGGGPVLLSKAMETDALKKPSPRHPRTALGFNARHFFLVVVDGRQPGLSVGMNYTDLAALMENLGCTDAMNLDGGGSSTFWLNGKVMNSPSDKRERGLATSLVILQR